MPVEVRPVASKRELKAFMRLPWRLYRNERNWVPPLLMDLRKRLDRKRNPFFEHAEAEYFLAWRDGRPVGRITAQIDRNFNEFQGNDWGMFGFFESEHGITVRSMRKRDLQAEVERFLEVYNAAWERNWGFVPLTEEEVRHEAKDLKPVLDENWALVAEAKDGTVVGAALTLPDYNQVLAHLNGRLLPFGWAKALYWRRKIDRVRVFALGVKREYQHTGVAA